MLNNFEKLPIKLQKRLNKSILEDEWLVRPILKYKNYYVPSYYEGLNDENNIVSRNYLLETIPVILYEDIIKNKEKFKNKKLVDVATGTGLGPIMLADNGLNVVGIERNRINMIGAIYTMTLNDIYYDIVYSDHRYIENMDYDVLILNATFKCWEFIDTLVPLMRREKAKGKEVLFYTDKKDPHKLLNFEKYRPQNIKDPLNTAAPELNYDT